MLHSRDIEVGGGDRWRRAGRGVEDVRMLGKNRGTRVESGPTQIYDFRNYF